MEFGITAVAVLTMLAYAVPGFILIKVRAIKEDNISAFAKVLLFVCQPCLSLYSFNKADYTPEIFKNMLIFMGCVAVLMSVIMLLMYAAFKKKYEDPRYRVVTVAAAFGNVGFFGVPLLEALFPQNPELLAYSAVYIVIMNLLAWTMGSALLTGNKKYISIKKLFLNPTVLSLIVALPMFFTCTKYPSSLENWITLLGKMTTPLCMLILGMRLATVKPFASLFADWRYFLAGGVKMILFPFLAFGAVYFLPLDAMLKQVLFILCCCPTASVVLNLSELYGCGQKSAANIVLLATMMSIITIPLLLLIL